jgi:hypothetical protein
MESNRVNLSEHKSTYVTLTFVLIVLSVVGLVLLYQIIKTRNTIVVEDQTVVPTSIPAETESEDLTPTIVVSPTASVTAKLSPTLKPTSTSTSTATPKLSPTLAPTQIPTVTSTPTPSISPSTGLLNYSNETDKFSVDYSSNRKVYADKESSGDRFTFTNILGNFAIHVGLNGKWAWINSDRNFTGNYLVAGQHTFKYEISSQTIVDLQYDNKNYTLQCIHNGRVDLKTECEQFLKSFKLL